ncbi:MAG TPA: diguanylate cyclase [Gammaproteobacteria bacterium]|nr:diguanylate cyclase [Gammaproteobacteria bacterium]
MLESVLQYEALAQVSIVLLVFLFLALWERARPLSVLTRRKWPRWFNNLSLMLCGFIILRVLMPALAYNVAVLAQQQQWGIINFIDIPVWLKVLLSLVLLDLGMYFRHTMFHVLPLLWRFHRVHHSDLDCDLSTGLRFHPIEIFISVLLKSMIILALGPPVIAVILFELMIILMSMFVHSNIRLNSMLERGLRWFFVTPGMHRVHHSSKENETNSNFSFHLSVWDRLFGTYLAEPANGLSGMQIGLENFREDYWQNIKGLLLMPFSSRVQGYAINYRDTKNEDELALARELAQHSEEKARLSSELSSYMKAINEHALVSVTDTAGKIVMSNDLFSETSGYSHAELIGKDHRIVNSGVHSKSFFTDLWETISSGRKWHGEICNRAKNGDLYWVDSAIVPNISAEGKIDAYVSVRINITERKRQEEALRDANEKLEKISRVDALTQVANRRHFDEMLEYDVNKMRRFNIPLTLIICDIDHFKKLNDTYGHTTGDMCLQKVAQCIKSSFLRTSDLVARYGGEEFAIILSNIDKGNSIVLVERMRKEVEALVFDVDPQVHITISAGLTTLIPDKDTTVTSIIKQADEALYMAKSKGRNNVQYFET